MRKTYMVYVKRSMRARYVGFTLVELLVVISIIALLLSVLLPSLNKARANAKKLVCKSNLKQIGIGIEMYVTMTGKYPQMLVWAGGGLTPTPELRQGWFGAYYVTWETMLIRAGCIPKPKDFYANGGAAPKQQSVVWRCPEQQHPFVNGNWRPVPPFRHYALTNKFPAKLENEGWSAGGVLKNKSDRVLIGEVDPDHMPFWPGMDETLMYFRHLKASNILFFDGHIIDVKAKASDRVNSLYSGYWR
jgi:prepilin-type N-terminal cleavage/methylation domain-containing protein/prepilin-type processing-associated H-X9-DG protein